MTYFIVFALLIALELCYFKLADHFNIIDKPNERSSHSSIVLRGGGVIFVISMIVWSLTPFPSPTGEGSVMHITEYWPFMLGLLLIAGVSFWDDVKSLPDSLRIAVQIVAYLLLFWSMGIMQWSMWCLCASTITCMKSTSLR